MSILIKGLGMPNNGTCIEIVIFGDGTVEYYDDDKKIGEATELPSHGDLIDMSALNDAMFHEAFETDSDMQKWDSGCWIRYKMFEKHRDLAPVIIPAERG